MGEVSLQPAGKAASCVTVIVRLGDGEAAMQLCPHRFLNRNHLGPALPGLPSRSFRSDFPTTSFSRQPVTPHPPEGWPAACVSLTWAGAQVSTWVQHPSWPPAAPPTRLPTLLGLALPSVWGGLGVSSSSCPQSDFS